MALILVVDDNEDTREGLARLLIEAGHKVVSVPNGREALIAVLDRNPDLVVLDLYMPEMDGIGFLEIVRSYLRLQTIPVVVLTGIPDSPLIDRARALHVNAVLVKGKTLPHEIVETIEQQLQPPAA